MYDFVILLFHPPLNSVIETPIIHANVINDKHIAKSDSTVSSSTQPPTTSLDSLKASMSYATTNQVVADDMRILGKP